jgi:hypothetical protein
MAGGDARRLYYPNSTSQTLPASSKSFTAMVDYTGLEKKHVLIAGAGRDIGAAVAWRLADGDPHLSLCDLNPGTLKSTPEAISKTF